MSLTSLPLHVVSDILNSLQPCDFESLALVSHGTCGLLTPFLDRHNAYRREWSQVVFGSSLPSICSLKKGSRISLRESTTLRTIRQLLKQIARDPASAFYVERLDMSQCEYPLDDEYVADPVSGSDFQDEIPTRDLIRDLIATSPTLQHMDLQNLSWYVDMELDEDRAVEPQHPPTIFLLSILPNLRKVSLLEECDVVHLELSTTGAQTRVRDPSKADTLKLVADDSTQSLYTQFGIDMTVLLPFLVRPALRKLHFDGGVLDWVDEDLWDSHRPIAPNLEELHMNHSCLSKFSFELLFQDMQALRVLNLHYEGKDDFDMNSLGFECQEMMNMVAGGASDTLESLRLTTSWWLPQDVISPLRSLKRFHNLKELEVGAGIFYCRGREGDPDWNYNLDIDLQADFEYTCEFYDSENEEEEEDDDDMDDNQSEGGGQSENSDDADMTEDDSQAGSDDTENGQADVDDDMDSNGGGSESGNGQFRPGDQVCLLAKTCPSIAQLLNSKSLAQLAKLTIHVEAEEAELLCLKRLLRDLRRLNVNSTDDDNAAGICPELKSIVVCLYVQNRGSGGVESPGAQGVITMAREYLDDIPRCNVRVVPYEGHLNANKVEWLVRRAHGEAEDASGGLGV